LCNVLLIDAWECFISVVAHFIPLLYPFGISTVYCFCPCFYADYTYQDSCFSLGLYVDLGVYGNVTGTRLSKQVKHDLLNDPSCCGISS